VSQRDNCEAGPFGSADIYRLAAKWKQFALAFSRQSEDSMAFHLDSELVSTSLFSSQVLMSREYLAGLRATFSFLGIQNTWFPASAQA
jgi:hypothetical protein